MNVFPKYIFVSLLVLTLTICGASERLVQAAGEPHESHQHPEEDHDHAKGKVVAKDAHDGHGHSKEEKDDSEAHDEHGKESGHAEEDHADHDHEGGSPHDTHGDHEGHGEHEEEAIKLDEEAQSMIKLKTDTVQKRKLGGKLKVYGKIAKDTENYSYITFEGEGRVEKIHIGLGAIVDKGDPLISVRRDDGSIEKITSGMHGAILSIFVKPRERIDRLTSLLSIVDVDTMRATIDIYEKDLRHIHVGQKVVLTTSAFPDKKFEGEVVYISPQVDEHTQSIKVRVDVKNPDHLLRLGMFVSGELIYASDKTVLAVPVSAIQQLNQEDIVFVADGKDGFKPKEIVLGQESGGFIEVKKGLREGEVVATQGSFYLKSEQAKEAFGDGHNH
jgi:multidrug efflux pump subunit AcrA (membrane-fusion protein)